MTGSSDIWASLGIDKTDNERDIRIAYSRKLKAIDVYSDAAAFIVLRSAYEAALASARGVSGGESWLDVSIEAPRSDRIDQPFESGRAVEPKGHRRLPPEIGELHAMFENAARENRRWLSADEKLVLRHCWAAITVDTDAGDIEHYAAVEQAVRWLILTWGTLAVGLVLFAVEYFHWNDRAGDVAEDGSLGEIIWRYQGIQFLRRVRHPGHSHHPAWVELTSQYFPGSARGRCNPLLVHELEAIVRHVWPEVETEFDPGRVALWADNTADPAHAANPANRVESWAMRVLGTIIVGFIILRVGGLFLALVIGGLARLFG